MSVPSPHKAFPFTPKPFALLHGKSGFLQTTADKTGRRKRCQCAAVTRQPCHCVKQILRPHIRVFRWRKAVQKPKCLLFDLANRPVDLSVR